MYFHRTVGCINSTAFLVSFYAPLSTFLCFLQHLMARSSNFLSYQIALTITLPEGYLPLELLGFAPDNKNKHQLLCLVFYPFAPFEF